MKKRTALILAGTLGLMLCFGVEAQAVTSFPDTQGHWAAQPIDALIAKGVLNGYPDGTFKPDQPVTRAELSKIMAKTFAYQADTATQLPDINGNWAQTYIQAMVNKKLFSAFPDGTFQPGNTVSRAKMASILAKAIHVAAPEEQYTAPWPVSFNDVPANHWAYLYIETVQQLGIFPSSFKTAFQPDTPVTRSEAVWMVKALNELVVSRGKISQVDHDTGLIDIQMNGSDPLTAMVAPDTVLLRNNATNNLDSLRVGDDATVIAAPTGEVKFFKAYGQVTKDDLLTRASSAIKGKLTKDEISSIITGDWDSVKDNLKGDLYNKLVDLGLSPSEAETIMVQDWNYLDSLSQDRLAQALSSLLGISQDFSQAILAKDAQKVKEYGKVELATAALGKLLGSN